MLKVAGLRVDQYSDNSLEDEVLYKLAVDAEALPEDVERLPDEVFALKIAGRTRLHRYWPCHNKKAALLSLYTFDLNAPGLPEELVITAAANFKKACEQYDIDHPVRHAEITEDLPDIVDYRLVKTDVKMTKSAAVLDLRYKVQEYLERAGMKEPAERVKLATELKVLADILGEKIEEQRVLDYLPKTKHGSLLKTALRQREARLAVDGKSELITELRNTIKLDDPADKIAGLLAAFDKTAGINVKTANIIDPYRAAYGGINKEAETFNTHTTWDYLLMSLANNIDVLNDNFSAEFIDGFQRAPQLTYDRATPAVKAKIKELTDKLIEKDTASDTRPSSYS